MTLQEIFTAVFSHVLIAGFGKSDPHAAYPSCAYRTRHGVGCAVGMFLSDASARDLDSFENSAIDDLFMDAEYNDNLHEILSELPVYDAQFWRQMQKAHDRSRSFAEFHRNLNDVAKYYRCELPVTPKEPKRRFV